MAFLKRIFRHCVPLFALISLLPENFGGTDVKPVRRVLILNEVNTSFPGIRIIDDGIRAAFDNSPYKLEVYREYLDTIYFPDEADQQRFRSFFIQKYQDHKPDVIVTVGPSPFKFMSEMHQAAFPGVPIVFCLRQWVPGETLVAGPEFTGVENGLAGIETVQAALHLQGGTKHVVVVGGISAVDTQFEEIMKKQLSSLNDNLDISYLTSLTMPDLLERLKRLPTQTIVLFTSFSLDPTGAKFISGAEAGPMIVAAANAPVFSLTDASINHGEVGGKLSYLREQGRIAGGIVLRILGGEKPRDIPVSKAGTTYMFDWRALKRWGFRESDLPPGSIVLNRQPTSWELYNWYIVGGLCLLLVQTSLIIGLLWQRAVRRKTDALRRESENRLAGIVGTAMDAIIAIDEQQRIVLFNPAAEKMFCCPQQEAVGTTIERFIPERSRLKHAEHIQRFGVSGVTARLMTSRGVLWAMRANGEEFPMEASISRIESDSKKMFTVIVRDITERKRAEEALSTVGRRLIEAHEQERTWIGRELHDDITQQLALLAVELDQVSRGESPTSYEHLSHAKSRIMEISKDVQALSHRLHSSKLDYLGLTRAAESFCKELSENSEVEVHFDHSGVPSTVPKEISLCLFRVLQEALQNATKHSGVRVFRVNLNGTSNGLELTVSDEGKGFDEHDGFSRQGIGLISMHERLQMVHGILEIKTQPGTGTTISARVPLHKAEIRAIAG